MFIIDEMKKAREIIESFGYTIIEEYTLINNYGIVFTDGANRFDARHWINCYGAECNSYSVNLIDTPELNALFRPEMEIIEKELNDMIWGN